ncbi:MAG: arylsulfatase [Gemmatimonadetes bacterium]|nr:arylsulfatase [Gemmatimonadota bacterium]MYF74144.1 arylsulfatase [Gemmatimonadota bacterium]MYK53940.1 arylsulfatase [Gemmatimonadota bacterium]
MDEKNRPNVVLIITDDQGYGTVGVHGNDQIRTPYMDRLANEGVAFDRFYGHPLCSPSRAALMTGRYFYRTGILHTSRGGALMSGDEVTAAELFRDAGYRTGIFGKWHLGDNYPMRPMDQGFEKAVWHKGGGIGQAPVRPNSYFDSLLWREGEDFQAKGYCTDVFFDEALVFIEEYQSEPFFIYIPTNAPHGPLEISDEYADPYREMGLDDSVARIYGMVENIDDNIGRLLELLERLGLDEDTIIIFTSDHGPAGGRYNAGLRSTKGDVYEGGIRVPYFMRWPKGLPAGFKTDKIASHIDVLPTLLSLCNVDSPSDLRMDGVDLTPLIRGHDVEWLDRTLFIQTHRGSRPRQYHNCTALTQRYKWLGDPGTGGQWDFETSSTDPVMELYDLEDDPGEEKEIGGQMPDLVAQMRKDYDAWFDDVASDWQAGVIHIGNSAENPLTLCRYQDSEYISELPHGWRVKVEQSGTYEFRINRESLNGAGALGVQWQGNTQRSPLAAGENTGRFELEAGDGNLEIWFELEDIGRVTFSSNLTIGDVEVDYLG